MEAKINNKNVAYKFNWTLGYYSFYYFVAVPYREKVNNYGGKQKSNIRSLAQ